MSGTKHDQDKAPLIYNYWDGIFKTILRHNLITTKLQKYLCSIEVNIRAGCLDCISDIVNTFIGEIEEVTGLDSLDLISVVSKVCKMGADKYGHHNYLDGIHYSRLLSAASRHLLAGPLEQDKESGLPHWAHILSNLFMLVELISIGKHK